MSIIDDKAMTQIQPQQPAPNETKRLPLSALLALSAAGFITVMTEAMPAGILPAMSQALGVSEAATGQTITVYAIGSALTAVPLTAITMAWQRRHLLLFAVAGFAVANTVTALSENYLLTMIARLIGGVVAGLLWALLAGYARRLVAPEQRGKAMAIAMAGVPIALSLGVPAGTFLGNVLGWRYAFVVMSLLTVLLIFWVLRAVPNFPGQSSAERLSLRTVLALPGVLPVLLVTLGFVLAHNALYTYIAPFLSLSGLGGQVDLLLLVFGLASVLGIWLTGLFIDTRLRTLVVGSCALFAIAGLALGLFARQPLVVVLCLAIWGLSYGGAATLLQTASAEAAGKAGDVAQSLVVTGWNLGIAGGGLVGGAVLPTFGAGWLPWPLLVLALFALMVCLLATDHGFPAQRRRLLRASSSPLEGEKVPNLESRADSISP